MNNSERLSQLKGVRKQIKSKVTRFETFLLAELTEANEASFEERYTKFYPLLDEFEKTQDEIERLEFDPTKEDEGDESIRILFENRYYSLRTQALRLQQRIKEDTMPAESILSNNREVNVDIPEIENNVNVESINNIVTPPNRSVTMSLPMPALTLPQFNGDPSRWLAFYEPFCSMIHENTQYTDILKFQYLRSSLHGKALKVIESLSFIPSNYQVAWEALKNRYENRRLLVENQINTLLNLPIINRENADNVRNMHDNLTTCLESLKRQRIDTNSWDPLLIPIMSSKFDASTRRDWEIFINNNEELPTIKQLTDFLLRKCRLYEALHTEKHISSNCKQANNSHKTQNQHRSTTVHVTVGKPCPLCKETHFLFHCSKFLELSVPQRIQEVRNLNRCLNCFRDNHKTQACLVRGCRKCNKTHNTLLHLEGSPISSISSQKPDQAIASVSNYCHSTPSNSEVLLSTAIVHIADKNGKYHECRALLDPGSQCNFISNSFCATLNLKRKSVQAPVSGINQSFCQVTQVVTVHMKSLFSNFSAKLNCFVLAKIIENLPIRTFDNKLVNIPSNITLTDPKFNISNPIDLLIGADLFWELLCIGQLRLSRNQPYFQKTQLGWIIGGSLSSRPQSHNIVCNVSLKHLEKQLTKFWDIEEPLLTSPPDELKCEDIFVNTTTRDKDGKFIVSLPFKQAVPELGNSKQNAEKRLIGLEKRFGKNVDLKSRYTEFMQEYSNLGHMTKINTFDDNETNLFYFPHHAVFREHNVSTKTRVVFDGSCKSSNGKSINDFMYTGPVLQRELLSILLNFRTFQFVIAADIEKMYRQIWVHPDHQKYQLILWRDDSTKTLETCKLNTVTYGTTSAPYLTIRCLQELANINQETYPVASLAIKNDFYVDDLLSGANTPKEAIELKTHLQLILKPASFHLHKWASNDMSIIDPHTSENNTSSFINLDKQGETKTLGLVWNCNSDTLKYYCDTKLQQNKITKRSIVSIIAQFFDPLGLLGPVFISAKIIIQKLWSLKIGWDEAIPQTLYTLWQRFMSEVAALNDIVIPRKVIPSQNLKRIELHAFCDASQEAYGACVYIKTIQLNGKHDTQLLCAKSRVAPLKTVTLPRLELCGALLAARLMQKVKASIRINVLEIFYWIDSTLVLTWISGVASTWKTFIANRVAETQNLTKIQAWKHVSTTENPADIISRGVSPTQLKTLTLWWEGPGWLRSNSENYPRNTFTSSCCSEDILESKKTCLLVVQPFQTELFSRYSKYTRLQRVIAFCLRFISNSRNKNKIFTKTLSCEELSRAHTIILKLVQEQSFSEEISILKRNQSLPKSSQLISLNVFLDPAGLIRVGGRLTNAPISYDHKHPFIMPSAKHPVTYLLIEQEHRRLLHAGAQLTLSSLRQRIWPLKGQSSIKQVLRKCIPCFRVKPAHCEQLMGDLPSNRFDTFRPFIRSGVDYGGPIMIREGRGRGKRQVKAFIALFICFSTKAIHLELVSDLTTESFLAALRRFISRRGVPTDIYSDNGTNFVGANTELQCLAKLFKEETFKTQLFDNLSLINIRWHFIPPSAPHFGGIWEAGIKSAKYHLKRITESASMTFEEMSTLLTQVEACLNSRPLTAISNDPNDFIPLTPGHFLIDSSLTTINEPNLETVKDNRLSRWQYIQKLSQHFWKRWSQEYLSKLNQRTKWKTISDNKIMNGAIVVCHEPNLPPLVWRLGRIVESHTGRDNLIRVVTIKTSRGLLKRPITKISVLPIDT